MKQGISLVFALVSASVFAQSPVGLWKTIDDATGKEKSSVRVSEAGGVVSGKIESIVDPAKQDSKCDECSDERKGKPVIGMTILRNAKKGDGVWEGGDILDPNNGKVYRVRLTPSADNKKMQVHGYFGVAIFGRTQTWVRAE